MGASSSKVEEDKALQLCRERKKFVKQALNGRCSLAAAHVAYIHTLKSTGTALRKFVEPEAPIESSLYTSTSATPDPLALTEKSLSQFSFPSPSNTPRTDATITISPSPSPPSSNRFHANLMKFGGFASKKVEEKLVLPVVGTVTSSDTPQHNTSSIERPETSSIDGSSLPPETPQWDYFGFFHPIDNQFSFQEDRGMNHRLDNVDDFRGLREEEGIPELEDEEEKEFSHGGEESLDSDDEFDEPTTDTLIRSFENVNRVHDHVAANVSPTMPSTESVASETELSNREKGNSPGVSSIGAASSAVPLPTNTSKAHSKEGSVENKVTPKDLFTSVKEIEYLFVKASESGKEVPRMLEANKLNFRPVLPGKEKNGLVASTLLKACFSCGEDPSHAQEEPAQKDVKYLTWHRTTSSRSSSSRNLLGENSKDDFEDRSSNINSCMISGSHASTLDRLYAWERKLYDEVKASEMVRREYEMTCKILRGLESKEVAPQKIDKTRAVVKDLHSRIRVAIHRIESISKRIEELRDQELQPQLEELIAGLSRMWEVMFECHKLQFNIILVAYINGATKISIWSETHRQITIHLEDELNSLSSTFTKWIVAQKAYLQAINGWLLKCVSLPQKNSKRNRRAAPLSVRSYGPPPIYVTCSVWLEKLNALPTSEVTNSIKGLVVEVARLMPRQEKNPGKATRSLLTSWKPPDEDGDLMAGNTLGDEASEDFLSGLDRFRSSMVGFFCQLNNFAESSAKMYAELEKAIQDAKHSYELPKTQR